MRRWINGAIAYTAPEPPFEKMPPIMVVPFPRSATMEMMTCSLALRDLAKTPDSML